MNLKPVRIEKDLSNPALKDERVTVTFNKLESRWVKYFFESHPEIGNRNQYLRNIMIEHLLELEEKEDRSNQQENHNYFFRR